MGRAWDWAEMAFFGALAIGDVSSSIALASREFLPKSCLIKYSPLCYLQTETFAKSQTYVSSLCTKVYV